MGLHIPPAMKARVLKIIALISLHCSVSRCWNSTGGSQLQHWARVAAWGYWLIPKDGLPNLFHRGEEGTDEDRKFTQRGKYTLAEGFTATYEREVENND